MTRRAPALHVSARVALLTSLALAFGLGACLDNRGGEDDPAGAPMVYIAQRKDFANFRDWRTFEKDVMSEHGDVLGTTTVYLNRSPGDDATEFPVGTIVVKTMKPADSDDLNIHAMVKRGGGFNPKGALGWEYFELAFSKKDGQPFYLWRGEKPPDGEQYQMLLSQNDIAMQDTEADCNSCHAHDSEAKDATFDELAELLK